jgi:hypothetical protein
MHKKLQIPVIARSKAWFCGRLLAGIAAWMSVVRFVCCQLEVAETDRLSLVSISFLSVKKMGDLYKLDVAESKYCNQIAQSPTIFKREAFKLRNHICIKIYVPVQNTPEKYTVYSEPESEKFSLETGTSKIEARFITQAELNDIIW